MPEVSSAYSLLRRISSALSRIDKYRFKGVLVVAGKRPWKIGATFHLPLGDRAKYSPIPLIRPSAGRLRKENGK